MTERVLIIDDDDALAAMLAEYLEGHGLGVEHAARPTQGLSLLKTAPFEAVVLDVMLPEMDGFEVVSRLRANERYPDPDADGPR